MDGGNAALHGCADGGTVDRVFWLWVMQCCQGVFNMCWHRDVNAVFVTIPFQFHATVWSTLPVFRDGAIFLESVDWAFSVLFVGVFDTKVVNTWAKPHRF